MDLRADRQQRLAGFRHHRAAAGDGERVVAGLRQVGEQGAHVGGGLEPMFRRDAAAVLFGQQCGPRRCTAARRAPRACRVWRSSSRWWRPAAGRARRPSRSGRARWPARRRGCGGAVPDGAVRETPPPSRRAGVRLPAFWPSASRRAIGPVVPPVSSSRPSACVGDALERKLRLQRRVGVQEADRRQALQVGQARGVLRQQHHRVGRQARVVGAGQGDLAADDRLDALAGAVLGELQRAEQIAGVGDRRRRACAASFARAAILSGLMAPSLSE